MLFESLPNMDIISFIKTLAVLGGVLVVLMFVNGVRSILNSRTIPYFKIRQDRLRNGWRMIFIGFIVLSLTLFFNKYAPNTAGRFFPMTATQPFTATPTVSPTITIEPTITLTPSITPTLDKTYTPTVTPTPYMPLAIEAQFQGQVTPPASAAFSNLVFAQGLDENYQPINPNVLYSNPVGHLYAMFSYNEMLDGVQWTALWLYQGELVYYETLVWDSGAGGYGYSDYWPEPEVWLPGSYQVQIFIGNELKTAGDFLVEGDPLPATPTITPTLTITPTPTITETSPPTLTATITPTRTPWPTWTLTPTWTPWPNMTETTAVQLTALSVLPLQTTTPTPQPSVPPRLRLLNFHPGFLIK